VDDGTNIVDRKNGDVACNSYNQIMDDIEILKNMKVGSKYFEISLQKFIN
jgi:hypothetical protein